MDFELISAEEFERLSEDDERCFVEFEAICRPNLPAHRKAVLRGKPDELVAELAKRGNAVQCRNALHPTCLLALVFLFRSVSDA